MKIWLDDKREPPSGWAGIRNVNLFYLVTRPEPVANDNNPIEEISFDHDLGDGPDGYDCAKWLIDTYRLLGLRLPKMSCHSQNPVGRERIERLIAEVT